MNTVNPATTLPCLLKRYVVEVLFVGEDDAPVADIAVELRKGPAEVLSGRTDRLGKARFDGLQAGMYQLSACELDQDAWEVLTVSALDAAGAEGRGEARWLPPDDIPKREALIHTVQEGDCTAKVAYGYGMFPQTVWDHGENAALKELRRDMNILYAGDDAGGPDKLYIPTLRIKAIGAEVGRQYLLRRRGVPAMLRVRFIDEGMPRADIPYLLTMRTLDGVPVRTIAGATDAAGYLIEYVPPLSFYAELVLGKGADQEFHDFLVGYLDPADKETGIFERLQGLGYDMEDGTEPALAEFCVDHGVQDGASAAAISAAIKKAYLS